jgi:hypothetical protein
VRILRAGADLSVRWRAPGYIRDRTEAENDKIREDYHILVSGDDIPPPIPRFEVSTARFESSGMHSDPTRRT